MSSIVTSQGVLHYQSIGRGEPIILLHGWVNSWQVWRDAMLTLAGNERHRVYALDFWGFGSSGEARSNRTTAYRIDNFVEMVRQFMDNLGINQAPITGHSMGGTVAIQFALTYPDRVTKVIVVGSPISGDTLNPVLKLAGNSWIASLIWRFPSIRTVVVHLLLARDSRQVRRMIFQDIERTTLESFFRSINDLHKTDLRDDLARLSMPTLAIYGKKDNIVSPSNANLLADFVKGAQVAILNQSRHFPMNDEPEIFVNTLTSFLKCPVPTGTI